MAKPITASPRTTIAVKETRKTLAGFGVIEGLAIGSRYQVNKVIAALRLKKSNAIP
jgi:hypothetical protein